MFSLMRSGITRLCFNWLACLFNLNYVITRLLLVLHKWEQYAMKIKLYKFNGFLQSEKEILNLHLYDLEDDGEVLKLFPN